MKLNLLQKLNRRERRVMQRIDKANWSGQSPMIVPPSIQYELADRVQAMNPGGLGVVQQMVKQLDLAETINRICPICTPNMGVNLWGEDDFGHPVPCTKTGLNKEAVCQMFLSE